MKKVVRIVRTGWPAPSMSHVLHVMDLVETNIETAPDGPSDRLSITNGNGMEKHNE